MQYRTIHIIMMLVSLSTNIQMWPMPSIKKEHAYLAGGILGGICIGAGLYAAYQAIKYRGKQYVSNTQAKILELIRKFPQA